MSTRVACALCTAHGCTAHVPARCHVWIMPSTYWCVCLGAGGTDGAGVAATDEQCRRVLRPDHWPGGEFTAVRTASVALNCPTVIFRFACSCDDSNLGLVGSGATGHQAPEHHRRQQAGHQAGACLAGTSQRVGRSVLMLTSRHESRASDCCCCPDHCRLRAPGSAAQPICSRCRRAHSR
jgi:hypothetical protein